MSDGSSSNALVEIKSQIKAATKDLGKINRLCLSGENELTELQNKKLELDNKIAELTNITLYFEDLKEKVKQTQLTELELDTRISQKIRVLDNLNYQISLRSATVVQDLPELRI